MGVVTTYDEKRYRLMNELNECLKLAKELLVGEDIWGYDQMRSGYAEEVYFAVKKARDAV